MRGAIVALITVMAACAASAGTVDLTLYNTEPLLDSDGSTKLEGDSGGGDLVQLILAGANGSIDAPTSTGEPGGDDSLLSVANNPTFVGAGMVGAGTGKLTQSGMVYDDSLVGETVYVRFWNSDAASTATHYGNSKLLTLPAADAFGEAELDFVPATSDPRTTDTAFTFATIPTLSEWGVICLVALVLGAGALEIWKREAAAMKVAAHVGGRGPRV